DAFRGGARVHLERDQLPLEVIDVREHRHHRSVDLSTVIPKIRPMISSTASRSIFERIRLRNAGPAKWATSVYAYGSTLPPAATLPAAYLRAQSNTMRVENPPAISRDSRALRATRIIPSRMSSLMSTREATASNSSCGSR